MYASHFAHPSISGHWVASVFGLLRLMLLWTWMYKYLFKFLPSVLSGYIPRGGIAEAYGSHLFLILNSSQLDVGILRLILQFSYLFSPSHLTFLLMLLFGSSPLSQIFNSSLLIFFSFSPFFLSPFLSSLPPSLSYFLSWTSALFLH